ncbi:MAG: hypothetical protein OEV40_24975 [Acidimicrobiia bacterium]|nr:hypothetical protein [Acidimicrobiia bacterium]
MEETSQHPGLARIVGDGRTADALDVLADELIGSDLTTVLLEVARRRAARLTPADVVRQYRRDRFVAPAAVDPLTLARLELAALETVADEFEPVVLSPVAPFGTHSVLGGVHQNNVVTTLRLTEVAADPTNSLALEAAVRRRRLLDNDPRSAAAVGLAAVQRITRAQRFDGPRSFAHFSLLGLTIAGRDVGSRRFETEALTAQLRALAHVALNAMGSADESRIEIRLSDFDGRFSGVVEEVSSAVAGPQVDCESASDRTAGRGYYPNVCFKLSIDTGSETIEVADGGAVDWTQSLLQDRKERLTIAGLSLDRLALLATD